jgi:hypothetical protein
MVTAPACAAEAENRGYQPPYAALGFGECRNSGLTCTNTSGHGWTLPRYRGLPAYF